jgi:hypothetical protein
VKQTTTLCTNELKRQNQQVHQLNSILVETQRKSDACENGVANAYLELLRGQNPHNSVQMATQSLESVLQEQKEYKKVDPLLLSEAATINNRG